MTTTIAGVSAAVHAVSAPPADKVSPGLLGFIVVFVLALATWLLMRSMVGHMRKVRYSPEPGEEPGTEADGGKPATAATGGSEGPGTPANPDGSGSAG